MFLETIKVKSYKNKKGTNMNNVLDIARYVIKYSNEKDYDIYGLKLHALLYFVQASFVLKTGNLCFDEPIVKTPYGCIITEVVKEFGGGVYTLYNTDEVIVKNSWNIERKRFDKTYISEEDRKLIQGIVDGTRNYFASQLFTIINSTEKDLLDGDEIIFK